MTQGFDYLETHYAMAASAYGHDQE